VTKTQNVGNSCSHTQGTSCPRTTEVAGASLTFLGHGKCLCLQRMLDSHVPKVRPVCSSHFAPSMLSESCRQSSSSNDSSSQEDRELHKWESSIRCMFNDQSVNLQHICGQKSWNTTFKQQTNFQQIPAGSCQATAAESHTGNGSRSAAGSKTCFFWSEASGNKRAR